MTRFRHLITAAAALAAVALTACGGTSVGNSNLASFTVAPVTAAPASAAATAASTPPPTAPPTQRPAATPRPSAPVATLAISINPDSMAPRQFDPNPAQCPAGTEVTWTNHDSQARSVVSSDGAFNSGPIAPGASWTWKATSGSHAYQDGTRNYVTGTLTVQ